MTIEEGKIKSVQFSSPLLEPFSHHNSIRSKMDSANYDNAVMFKAHEKFQLWKYSIIDRQSSLDVVCVNCTIPKEVRYLLTGFLMVVLKCS